MAGWDTYADFPHTCNACEESLSLSLRVTQSVTLFNELSHSMNDVLLIVMARMGGGPVIMAGLLAQTNGNETNYESGLMTSKCYERNTLIPGSCQPLKA